MKRDFVTAGLCLLSTLAQAQDTNSGSWPAPETGDFMIENFSFDSGETLDSLKIHYQTLGELQMQEDGSTNAVLIMHGSTFGSEQFMNDDFAGVLFNPGQLLNAEKYFIILPDGIGHGNSSSPKNTGLHAKFPSYQYSDIVRSVHQLLTDHLGVNHVRLVMGVSMGGMHTGMWGEQYPEITDALFPIACLPVQIGGHNRLWRKFFIDLIKNDPDWNGGEYESQPMTSLKGGLALAQVMLTGPLIMQREYPTRDATDEFVDYLTKALYEHQDTIYDANDQMYTWNASYTYDPEADLGKIKAPLTAVNTADDLMNPPEVKILERCVEIQMTPGVGKAVVIPASNDTIGHGTYILADVWKDELKELLERSEA